MIQHAVDRFVIEDQTFHIKKENQKQENWELDSLNNIEQIILETAVEDDKLTQSFEP